MHILLFSFISFFVLISGYPDGTTIPLCVIESSQMTGMCPTQVSVPPPAEVALSTHTFYNGTTSVTLQSSLDIIGAHIILLEASDQTKFLSGLSTNDPNLAILNRCGEEGSKVGSIIHKRKLATKSLSFNLAGVDHLKECRIRAVLVYSRTVTQVLGYNFESCSWDIMDFNLTRSSDTLESKGSNNNGANYRVNMAFLQLQLDGPANDSWQAFKLNKLKDDSGKPVQWLTFKFDNPKEPKAVQLDKQGSTGFDEFKASLPENESRYGIFNLTYKKGDGDRQKVALLVWAPDASPVKARMLIASNKDAFKTQLQGIHVEFQGATLSEIEHTAWVEQALSTLK